YTAKGIFYNNKEVPYIEIAIDKPLLMVSFLLHELVHAKQFRVGNGDLTKGVEPKYYLEHFEYAHSMKKSYVFFDKEYLDYLTSPWEYEAYKIQGEFGFFYNILSQ
ncbi:MAG: hypothetical protein ACRDD7_12500, partial [Peptostreptococcaceae bacterium]